MTNLDYYFTEDHRARQRTTLISVAVGAGLGMSAELWGVPFRYAAFTCIAATSAAEISIAMTYRRVFTARHHSPIAGRRSLIFLGASTLFFLLLESLRFLVLNPHRVLKQLQLAELSLSVGEKKEAGRHIEQATQTLQTLAVIRVPTSTFFFESIVSMLTRLRSAGLSSVDVNAALLKLADYRSVLNVVPELPKQKAHLQPTDLENNFTQPGGTIYSIDSPFTWSDPTPFTLQGQGGKPVFDCSKLPTGEEILRVWPRPIDRNPVTVKDCIFIGGSQTLDYIIWQDTVFIRSRIRFSDGDVALAKVVFVECLFDFVPTARGEQVAEYAALQSAKPLTLSSRLP